MSSSSENVRSSPTVSMIVRRLPAVPKPAASALELLAHDAPDALRALLGEELLDRARALPLLLELLLDDEDLEAREAIEAQLEDRVGLLVVELEPRHDLLGGVGLAVGRADDLEDLVERVEDDREAVEDVHPPRELGELVLEALRDDVEAEVQEVPEHRPRSRRSGRPTSGFSVGTRQVRLTANVFWSGVFLKR